MNDKAGLAQSVERQALNLMVGGSSPPFGVHFLPLECGGQWRPPRSNLFAPGSGAWRAFHLPLPSPLSNPHCCMLYILVIFALLNNQSLPFLFSYHYTIYHLSRTGIGNNNYTNSLISLSVQPAHTNKGQ